jgi:hypothetical protein
MQDMNGDYFIFYHPLAVNQLALKHHRTLVDERGNVLAAKGPDLWAEIQCARKRLLMDTNFPWRQHLADKDYSDCAFILGTTIQMEMDRSTGVLFDLAGRQIVAHNYFLFTQPEDLHYWVIDRMDEYYYYIHNQDSLKQDAKDDPPISWKTATDAQRLQLQDEAKYLRSEIRRELISILQRPKRIARQQLLIQEVQNQKESCFKNFPKAREIARRCYAALLINDQSARSDYRDKEVNGLEDSVLIGEALFLNAEILSCDSHVQTMGRRYCQIPVHKTLTLAR